MGAIAAAASHEPEGDPRLARLQEELACRDEIIVALQHVVRDLRHELENLRHLHAVWGVAVLPPEHAEPEAEAVG